jgi:type IV secretion system protein VirB5
MPAAKTATETPWTQEEAILIDHVGNEVYASHYAERKAYRFMLAALTVLLACSVFGNVSLAKRRLVYRYIRIDEMGRAQAIQYNDLDYSPREGEIRTYLTDWANYRYTINRETIAKKYSLNYYFLAQPLASQLMGEDNQNHLVSQVMSGQVEQSDVEVRDVTITSMSVEMVSGAKLAKGTALVSLDKLYSPRYSRQPRTEHWVVSVTYYLNPAIVNDEARTLPQFETLNPLGLVITEFHENRVSVGPYAGGANSPVSANIAGNGGAIR